MCSNKAVSDPHDQGSEDDSLRMHLKEQLTQIDTQVEPRAYSHEEILDVVSQLQQLSSDDYDSKLIISGFTLVPYGEGDDEQACETCMYYQTHRKFCELPELMIPVEKNWSCRLWRI